MAAEKDLEIWQGKTFPHLLRWEAPPYIYKPITGVQLVAPVRIACVGHGLVTGWRAAVVSVKGTTELNAKASPPDLDTDFRQVTVVDADTVEINTVNAADFKAYISGGYLQYLTPVDMTGFTARLVIKNKVGGTEILRLTTEDGGITINNSAHTIALYISAAATALLAKGKGTYELEMVSATGIVTPLMYGAVTIKQEVAT